MAIQKSWQKEIGGNFSSPNASLKLDPNGSLYANWIEQGGAVVAMFSNSGQIVWRKQGLLGSIGSVDSDYLYFAATLENVNPQVPFVSKYSQEGPEVWRKQLIFSGTSIGADVAVSNDSSLYLVGYANGGIDEIINNGSGDSFVAKYDKDGNRQWVTLVGTSEYDSAYSVATSKDGAIFVVGQESGSYMLYSGRGYLAKLNADGTLQWKRQISSDQPTSAERVVVSQEGDVYIAGQQAAGGEDLLFISKYTSQGELTWKRTLDVSTGNKPISLQIDDTGSVYSSVAKTIVKLDRDGEISWKESIGVGFTTIEEMVVDGKGGIYAIVHAINWIGQPEVDEGIFLTKYVPNNGNGTPGAITGSGAFREGVTLTAPVVTGDPDGMPINPNYKYQWFKNNSAISSATGKTYKVPTTGSGTYRVDVTYADAQDLTATVNSDNQFIAKVISGTAKADTLRGTVGDDLITGLGGADRLTGRLGKDTFQYRALSDSRLSAYDRITDFTIGTDIFDAPRAVSSTNIKQLKPVSALTQAGIEKVLGKSNSSLGKQVFASHRAATFTVGTGGSVRTFLGVNDATAGFDQRFDALVEITGFSGSLANLAIV